MTPKLVVIAGMAWALGACGDGQAGSDYRGEPLMSIQGVVTTSEVPLSSSLVPALVYNVRLDWTPSEPRIIDFTKSDVEGTFPSSFTMRIFDPPPAERIIAPIPGEPGYAHALIVAVSGDHPNWLRSSSYSEPTGNGGERSELCDDTGECISGYLSECPEGEQQPESDWPCGGELPDHLPWEIYAYSENYRTIYFDGPVAAGSVLSRWLAGGEAVSAGYHLVKTENLELTLPPAEFEELKNCNLEAATRATEAFNQTYDTNKGPQEGPPRGLEYEWHSQMLTTITELGCKTGLSIETRTGNLLELAFTGKPLNAIL